MSVERLGWVNLVGEMDVGDERSKVGFERLRIVICGD